MSQPNYCPECGATLPESAPDRLCPACLLKRGLEANTMETLDEPGGARSRWTPPDVGQLAGLFPELEIQRLIGRGGMGAVYQVRQKNLDRVVALKVLPPEMGNDAAFAERFTREAQAMARLNHPHIVTLYEFGQRPGLFYFLMEYVDGMNLRGLEATGHVSPREALAIIPQICDALQYAHDQGIVHRDIKPENILLNKQGQVKIADFGLAKLMGRAMGTVPERVMGTPQYMAPEQIDRPTEVDHRADIYSLGIVFYQLLTGELPGRQIEPPSRKVRIDVRLDEVVLRAMEHEPARRYQQASVLGSSVETIAMSSPERPQPEHGRSGRRLPTRWPAAWFSIFYLAFAVLLLHSRHVLPARVASHFGINGNADGWMKRTGYLVLLGALPGVLAIFFSLLAWLTRYLPAQTINVPRRDYWLAPQRRVATSRLLLSYLLGLTCILTVFFAGVHLLTVHANTALKPPRLEMGPLMALVIGLFIAIIVWITKMLMRLSEAGEPEAGPPRKAAKDATGWPKRYRVEPKPRFWKRRLAKVLIAVVIILIVRALAVGVYRVEGRCLDPELPAGSHILVWKLLNHFHPGEVVAYRVEKETRVGRVARVGKGFLIVNRNGEADAMIDHAHVIGKVVSVYWRTPANSPPPAVTQPSC